MPGKTRYSSLAACRRQVSQVGDPGRDSAATAAATLVATRTGEIGVGADVAHRGLHRIGLTLAAALALALAVAALAAVARTRLLGRTTEAGRDALGAGGEAAVEGLLERVGNVHRRLVVAVEIAVLLGRTIAARRAARRATLAARRALLLALRALGHGALTALATVLTIRTVLAFGTFAAFSALGTRLGLRTARTPVAAMLAALATRELIAPAAALCTVGAIGTTLAIAAATPPAIAARTQAVHAGQCANGAQVVFADLDPDAALEATRQHHGAVADADQAADRQADRVEELAHRSLPHSNFTGDPRTVRPAGVEPARPGTGAGV